MCRDNLAASLGKREHVRLTARIAPLVFLVGVVALVGGVAAQSPAPIPLVSIGQPVDWWFAFKLNAKTFPGCGPEIERSCPFGGKVQPYKQYGEQFLYASSTRPTLKKGSGCAGETTVDPVGATFDQIYNGTYNYLVWNDQFYGDPTVKACGKSGNCNSPWGHSKGMLAWNDSGEGVVLQVSTPSWPAAGSQRFPRKSDGNTLGCIKDNDVLVSQHFFALRLNKQDVITVLQSLQNASIATDPSNRQIAHNGGPQDIQVLVSKLGSKVDSNTPMVTTLSTGVVLISKPSHLNVPPWQMVSALLGHIPLRAATWWATPQIPTTTSTTKIKCWDKDLGKPGPVEIATTGEWNGTAFGLQGGLGANFNHAKIGVSLASNDPYVIFGDLNQQGTLSGSVCSSSQNGRGGLFYVLKDKQLHNDVTDLIGGDTASIK